MPKCHSCGSACSPGNSVCVVCGIRLLAVDNRLTPGTLLNGQYEIEEFVTSGGMGHIYFAVDRNAENKPCVVKQVKEQITSPAVEQKLRSEAKRMAAMSQVPELSSRIAELLHTFVHDGHFFIVQQRIHGKTLEAIFEERGSSIGEAEVVDWAIQSCRLLSACHGHGAIHRDISPDNLMLTPMGDIMFIDFGTLRELQRVAQGTAGIGKFGYAPPEQWAGKPVPQSDVFALGATMYYLLTGHRAVSNEYQATGDPQKEDFAPVFPPIRTKNSKVSQDLESILSRALDLDPTKRYQSADGMRADLHRVGMAPTSPVKAATSAAGAPRLEVDLDRLEFGRLRIAVQASKHFLVSNIGGGSLSGSITASESWMKVSNTIDPSKHRQRIVVTVDTSHLKAGSRASGHIDLNTNGGRARLGVALEVAGHDKALKDFTAKVGVAAAIGGASLGSLLGRTGDPGALVLFFVLLLASIWLGFEIAREAIGMKGGFYSFVRHYWDDPDRRTGALWTIAIGGPLLFGITYGLWALCTWAPTAGGTICGIVAFPLLVMLMSARLFAYQCSNRARSWPTTWTLEQWAKTNIFPAAAILAAFFLTLAILL